MSDLHSLYEMQNNHVRFKNFNYFQDPQDPINLILKKYHDFKTKNKKNENSKMEKNLIH